MKTLKFTGTKRFYDYNQEQIVIGEGDSARRFYPPLLDADGKQVVKTVSLETLVLEECDDDLTLGEILDAQIKLSPAGTNRDDVRGDVGFGMKNRQTGRVTGKIMNPTKPPSVKIMKEKIMDLLLETEQYADAKMINATSDKAVIQSMYTELEIDS